MDLLNKYWLITIKLETEFGFSKSTQAKMRMHSNISIIYTKDYYQFIKDSPFNYRFKDKVFTLFCCMNIYKMHNNIVAKGREYGVLKLLHTIWDKVCPLYFLSEYIIYKYV